MTCIVMHGIQIAPQDEVGNPDPPRCPFHKPVVQPEREGQGQGAKPANIKTILVVEWVGIEPTLTPLSCPIGTAALNEPVSKHSPMSAGTLRRDRCCITTDTWLTWQESNLQRVSRTASALPC